MFSRLSSDGLPIVGINFSIMSNVAMKWLDSLKSNINFYEEPDIRNHSFIQVASIIPVPEPIVNKKNSLSPSKNKKKIKAIENNNRRIKNGFKIIEIDIDRMMHTMRERIKVKKNEQN